MAVRQPLIRGLKGLLSKQRLALIWISLTVLLLLIAITALSYDLAVYTPEESLAGLWTSLFKDSESSLSLVIWQLRLPRLVMGFLVGASLAVAGCLMQAIFKNPLATPSLVGVSSGASFFAALMIVGSKSLAKLYPLPASPLQIPFAAFAGSLLVCMLVYRISHRRGQTSVALLLMSGVALNAIAEALTGFLIYLANDDELRSITFWSLGSLSGSGWFGVLCLAPFVLLALVLIPFTYKAMNALSAGDEMARHIGFDVEVIKKLGLLYVALAVGVSVAFTGRIGFIGLMVPHIARMMLGANHRQVLLASFLLGPIILIAADFLSQHLASPSEIPIGILTSAIGGPFFLYLLLKMRKGGLNL